MWKLFYNGYNPLNVITLGPREPDYINQMITISECIRYKRMIREMSVRINLITLTN
jgi:hypothetical protein